MNVVVYLVKAYCNIQDHQNENLFLFAVVSTFQRRVIFNNLFFLRRIIDVHGHKTAEFHHSFLNFL